MSPAELEVFQLREKIVDLQEEHALCVSAIAARDMRIAELIGRCNRFRELANEAWTLVPRHALKPEYIAAFEKCLGV